MPKKQEPQPRLRKPEPKPEPEKPVEPEPQESTEPDWTKKPEGEVHPEKHYPRFITHAGLSVAVQSEAEEKALEDGRAFVHVTKSAEGDITSVEYRPK